VLYLNHGKRAAKTSIHHVDIPSFKKTVTTLGNAAPLEPWNLVALLFRVLFCHKTRVLIGEMSVAHSHLIPVYNQQDKALSIPAVT
jgi:hypothetical protein